MKGTERSVADIAADNRGWVALGTVTAATAHTNFGYLLDVTLQPSGREVQARLTGRRLLLGAEVGDEVLVLFPDGDPNRAVAFPAELVSSAAPLPSSWTNGGPQIVDAAGLECRTSETATVAPVVVESLLTDLQGAMTEILALFGALAALGITLPSTATTQLVSNLPSLYRAAALKSE